MQRGVRHGLFVLLSCLVAWAAPAKAQSYFPSPDDWRDQNFYFIFTDRFNDGDPSNNNANPQSSSSPANSRRIHGGDFKGIQDKLHYIKALGATALWITPIPQNYGNAGYHGYGADDFYTLQPNWGTTNDLKNLVNAAHELGIYVCLDIVLNHQGDRIDSANNAWNTTFNINGYTPRWRSGKAYPAPFNLLTNFHNNGIIKNYTDPEQILGELSGLDDLRTETEYVRTNLVEIYKHWIAVADFDGFRLDTVKHVDIGAWQHFNPAIRAYANSIGKTNFFQFGEVFDGDDNKTGYYTGTKAGGAFANDSVLDYPLYFRVNSVFAEVSGNTKQIEDRYNAIASKYDPYAQSRLVTFLDNHDQSRFMNKAANDTNRLALALSWLYTSRGIPCLYYGTEQNFNGSGDPNNREDMFAGRFEPSAPSVGDNFNMTQGSFLHIARLNNLRRLYPSLRRGDHHNLWANSSGPGLFAYARRLGDEEVFIAFNTAAATQTLPQRPTYYSAGTVMVNLFNTNETLIVLSGNDGMPSMSIPARGYKIFLPKTRVLPMDPLVIQQAPAHDSTNIVATTPITLTFSEPMDTNATQSAFSVTPSASGSFAWASNNTVMTFTPSPGLAGKTSIVVRVSTNAFAAESGNHLFGAFETRFFTSSAVYTDAVPPTILVQAPGNGTLTNGIFSVTGTATDNVAIASVEIQIDGGDWYPATGTTSWTYTLDSRNFLNGMRHIAARARDSSGNLSPISSIDLRFFNIPGSYEVRINAGSATAATNCDSLVWQADQTWSPGSFGYVNGDVGFIGNTISNICASAQQMYQSERYSPADGTLDYRFDVPEGFYEITLLQAETWVDAPGERVFDVYIENERVLPDFDIFAAAGGKNLAIQLVVTSVVSDAHLDIEFKPWTDNARISGIAVKKTGDIDTDGDGIPDWWLRGWFDHPTGQDADQSKAHQDADGDGYSNFEEYIAGSSPINDGSLPAISAITANQHPAVTAPGISGRLYDLQWKADLSTTDDWITVRSGQPGLGSPLLIEDTNAPPHGAYRLRIRLP